MSGWNGGAIREYVGRRTPEGVAPGPVGLPIVAGATTLGFALAAAVVGGVVAGGPLRLLSATAGAVADFIALSALHVFTLLGGS